MANYKQETISGEISKHRRAKEVKILNVFQSVPTFSFIEEEMTVLPDGTSNGKYSDTLNDNFSDPNKTFPLINPLDGSVIGEGKYQDVFVQLYSLYLKLAVERDERLAQEEADRIAAEEAQNALTEVPDLTSTEGSEATSTPETV